MNPYDQMKLELKKYEMIKYPRVCLFLVPCKCDAKNEEKYRVEFYVTIQCYPTNVNEAGVVLGEKLFSIG